RERIPPVRSGRGLSPVVLVELRMIAIADGHEADVADHRIVSDGVAAAVMARANDAIDRPMRLPCALAVHLIDHRLDVDGGWRSVVLCGPCARMDGENLDDGRLARVRHDLLCDKDCVV